MPPIYSHQKDQKFLGTKGTNIKHDYPTNVRVSSDESGLPIETVFMCFQIRSLDRSRFPTQVSGQISESKILEVEAAVRYCLGLYSSFRLSAIHFYTSPHPAGTPLLVKERGRGVVSCILFK